MNEISFVRKENVHVVKSGTIPCLHCLYLTDWTCYDALLKTMKKIYQENGLFINAIFSDCGHESPSKEGGMRDCSWM